MGKYYILADNIKPKTAFADVDFKTTLVDQMIPEFRKKTEFSFELFLRNPVKINNKWEMSDDISKLDHLWLDLQPNTLAWNIMSEKMKTIITNNMTGNENIIWMSIKINANGESRIYYVPRFEKKPDVLDLEKTKFGKDMEHIIIPCLSYSKVKDLGLFCLPRMFWEIPSAVYTNETVKKIIEKENLTGICFEEVKVAVPDFKNN